MKVKYLILHLSRDLRLTEDLCETCFKKCTQETAYVSLHVSILKCFWGVFVLSL